MSKVDLETVNGISGKDKICTLQPYKVLEIVPDAPDPEPTPPPVEEPDGSIDELFDSIIASLQKLRAKMKE